MFMFDKEIISYAFFWIVLRSMRHRWTATTALHCRGFPEISRPVCWCVSDSGDRDCFASHHSTTVMTGETKLIERESAAQQLPPKVVVLCLFFELPASRFSTPQFPAAHRSPNWHSLLLIFPVALLHIGEWTCSCISWSWCLSLVVEKRFSEHKNSAIRRNYLSLCLSLSLPLRRCQGQGAASWCRPRASTSAAER